MSEVARLRQQIELESQAAFSALYGLSQGSSRHETINAKLERIGQIQEELAAIVGSERATQIIVEALAKSEVSA